MVSKILTPLLKIADLTSTVFNASDPCNGLAWNCDPFLPGPEWNSDCSAQESIDISVATLQIKGAGATTLTSEHGAFFI